jgi:5'-nucleotidase
MAVSPGMAVESLRSDYLCVMRKPLILVTNDDGITAPGIRTLVEEMSALGDVVVVAPDSPQSGMGHAITMNQPLRIHRAEVFPGVEAWECSGTPVDCVKLAKHVVLKGRKIDLCVSGINHGSNASINIIYSGTLSAAMEASLEGIMSVGYSLLDYGFDADFGPCRSYVRGIAACMLAAPPKHTRLLNVNIPKGVIRGLRVCRQADARWIEEFQEARDPRGQPYYWLTGEFVNMDKGRDTDVVALEEGFISVVPSGHDLTIREALPELSGLQNLS